MEERGKTILAIVIVCLVLLLISGCFYYNYGTDEWVMFTVKKTERVVKSTSEGSSSKYLVFTETEVFENTDSLMWWKWNSSDVYGELEEGQTYNARVYGWRIPFLSCYRNIVELKRNDD